MHSCSRCNMRFDNTHSLALHLFASHNVALSESLVESTSVDWTVSHGEADLFQIAISALESIASMEIESHTCKDNVMKGIAVAALDRIRNISN